MPAPLNVDWQAIKLASVAGESDVSLSQRFGVKVNSIVKRRTREQWPTRDIVSLRVKERINNEVTVKSQADLLLERLKNLKTDGAELAQRGLTHFLSKNILPESYSDLKKAWDIGAEAVGLKQEGSQVNVAFSLGSIEKQAEVIELEDI